jgi:DNA-binding SARP family transcriptional activator
MSLRIHLLGRPYIEGRSSGVDSFRSRKSWALLTYLILTERPPSRSQLASLLFAEADDPIRALRWSLSEIRRVLGAATTIDGDPVELRLNSGVVVDVQVLMRGTWRDAVELPGLGSDLLDATAPRGSAAFDTWLLGQQRHVAAASEAMLHEAALGSMSRGELQTAIGYAVRAAAMSPLDENHQALLIRLYRMAGDDEGAAKQFAACVTAFESELGMQPGAAIRAAMNQPRRATPETADQTTIQAMAEAGSAAVSAGAVETGVYSLRTAVRLADGAAAHPLRVTVRLALAEALIHSLGGLDEEGLATLFEADEIAMSNDMSDAVAQARADLGYVDFLRGRYDRAEFWLTDALKYAGDSLATKAEAMTYLGAVESDRSNYRRAALLLERAVDLCHQAGQPRRAAFALSMQGRLNLFQNELDLAAEDLDASITLAEREHWLAFLPWPQALRGEVQLAQADPDGAAELLHQAFARACQLGDPCWEGMASRGLALVSEARGERERAFTILSDARLRANRLADPYVWLDGYILDAQCELGVRYSHPDTRSWIQATRVLASRTGMRGLLLRSFQHGATMGDRADADAAALLASQID